MLEVFTQRNFVVDFIRLKLNFIKKQKQKIVFQPPFEGLKGNVCTLSMARWKARGRLYIHRNWTFFAISYGWDVMSWNLSKSAFLEGVVTFSANFRERSLAHQQLLVSENYRMIALSCGNKLSAVHHLVLSQCTCVTDGQTDGQNYDSQDHASIAACAVRIPSETWKYLWK